VIISHYARVFHEKPVRGSEMNLSHERVKSQNGEGAFMNTRQWKVAIAGEAMVTRPFSVHEEPAFLEMVKLLRDADITYAHLETNVGDIEDIEWAAKGAKIGSYFMVDPRIADDLKWAGIDMVSNAFNHSGEFGSSGVLSTRRHCKRAGLACAGTGRDLEEARAPGYLETKKGRFTLVGESL
jgi:poly-gamma-glutamate capsule biosynthesis protein CapA/YwtB (metallophosphatase superfamily)